jgi:hypothetical protein
VVHYQQKNLQRKVENMAYVVWTVRAQDCL